MALTSVNKEFYKPKQQPVVGSTFLELKYDPATGDTILEEYSVTGGVRGPSNKVYENGVWEVFSGINTASEKEEVHNIVKAEIKKASAQSKGVVPPFVKNNEPSKDFRGPGTQATPSQSGYGILNPVVGVVGAIFGPADFDIPFTSYNEKDLFYGPSNEKLLTYPENILKNNQDTFVIIQYNYQAPGGDVFTKPDKYKELFTNTGLQRNSALKDLIGKVVLPMPNKVVDQNGVNWGGDSTNSATLAMGGYGYQNTAKSLLGQAALGGGMNFADLMLQYETKGLLKVPKEVTGALTNFFTAADAGQAALGERADMKAIISSLAMKNASYEIPAETILSRGFGVVPNSNLELLFNGPALRGFTFGYRMTPRSQKEAKHVRRIIRFFKQGMAARKQSGQAGAGSEFLKTPNVFKLRYQSAGKPIAGVNKFKICALTQFGVDYTPESQWTAYEDPESPGQPVSVVMNLTFNELEPVYESDYQVNNIFGSTEKDLESVTDNDVGY